MALERRPKHPVPEGVVPLNATAHTVKNNESFETLAQRYGVSMDDIIYFVSFRQACVRRAAAAAVSAVAREIDGFPWRRSGPPWPARPGSA